MVQTRLGSGYLRGGYGVHWSRVGNMYRQKFERGFNIKEVCKLIVLEDFNLDVEFV